MAFPHSGPSRNPLELGTRGMVHETHLAAHTSWPVFDIHLIAFGGAKCGLSTLLNSCGRVVPEATGATGQCLRGPRKCGNGHGRGLRSFLSRRRAPCDPKSPWQRGTNENTNGLLRRYFPKGTDMSALTQTDLDKATHSLNGRPRQTLHGMSPSEKLTEVLQ